MSAALTRAIDEARRGLLDLSTRNRLLVLPAPGRSRGVLACDDEDADFVWAALREGRAFGFEAAGAAPEAGEAKPAKRRARKAKAEGVATAAAASREEWQADDQLRVALSPEDLSRRLRDLMQNARTAREETGVATLSITLGALVWRDTTTPETERRAPLALVPAALERQGVSRIFRLRGEAEEVAENLSLREKLAAEFRVELPPFDAASYDPTAWAEAVAAKIGDRAGWRVEPDHVAVGLFSFAKFLMWRDLDPAANPGLLDHKLIASLVGGAPLPPQPSFEDDADVDEAVPVERLDHPIDMDGSQALAAEAVRRGGHVVIQGPPGTGKSQTITTIITQAVLDGRTVLFVAEKLAALEVVKRRLAALGLGAACLELHSEKQSKRAVLDELRATLALPPVAKPDRETVLRRLGSLRARLNRHAASMSAPVAQSGRPLHAVVGTLVALRARGVTAPELRLPAGEWDSARLDAARAAMSELVARAAEGGAASVWRGVTRDLTASDQDRLLAALPGWIRAIAAGAAALARSGRSDATIGEAHRLLDLHAALAAAPPHDAEAMRHPAWQAEPAALAALAEAASALRSAERDPRLLAGALDLSGLAEARAALAQPAGLLGFLSSARRAAQSLAERVARDANDPLPALDAALAGQAARAALQADALAPFGSLREPEAMAALVAWRAKHGAAAAAALAARDSLPDQSALAALTGAATQLAEAAGLAVDEQPAEALAARLADWAASPETLPQWLSWRRASTAEPALAGFAERLADGRLTPGAARDAFEYAVHEALLQRAMRDDPALAAFDGGAFDRLVEEFAEADRARIALTRAEATWRHGEALKAVRAGAPGLSVIKGEMEKKRGHLPVRELLSRAGRAVQAAKPIFMMSPLSVAQFLEPPHGLKPGLSFDLLVIDEASQVEPVDALGAIARCRQVVVVGDDRQMPPTRFFQRMTGEEESVAPAADAVAARDVESILGLANARGVPRAMLRWHYRSRHESLIATSNAEFYEGRLLVLPSPRPRGADLGLSLVPVAGAWSEGGNAIEAEAVAAAVLRHARERPGDTLGVAAFSERQRDAILDALEKARAASPETEPFFAAHPEEPFFVKNLENVQGDERDAIFISIGFAKKPGERLRMNFGPVSAEGGERRLNVLITRAKKRCVVFSGITADDIDLSRSDNVGGEKALKTFLGFAAGGAPAPRIASGEGEAAPIAEVIARAVAGAGRDAVKRVGLSGLFLDVAVRDGGAFVLGVEADAADWARVHSARDRERGRPGALAMMGWKLHRAWSLAWLARPEAETARLLARLGIAPAAAPDAPQPPETGLAEPYRAADPAVPRESAIAAVPFATLAEIVSAIVRIEAPVHADSVLERARILWGRDTLGAEERAALQQALRLAKNLHGLAETGGFWSAEGSVVVPRDRRAAEAHLRRIALVAPAEIEEAARRLLAAVPVVTEQELAAGVARMLGLPESAAPAIAARLAAAAGAGRISSLPA